MNTATQSHKETMSSRQRVLKAINHQVPDRVPIDLGGNQTGIHSLAYESLLAHLGIRDDVTIMDAVQQLAKPCEAVLERFHVDTRYIAAGGPESFKGESSKTAATGGCGTTSAMSSASSGRCPTTIRITWTSPITRWPMRPWPTRSLSVSQGGRPGAFHRAARAGTEDSQRNALRRHHRHLRRRLRSLLVHARLGAWFMDLSTDTEFCEALLDQTLKFWLDWFRLFLDEVGDVVDVVMIGDDLAGQKGPYSGRRYIVRSSSRGRRSWCNTYARGRRRKSGITLAAIATNTFPTCSTTASIFSIPCRSVPRTWTRRR